MAKGTHKETSVRYRNSFRISAAVIGSFKLKTKEANDMRRRAEKAGVHEGAKRPDRIPFAEYRVHDPEGNGFDISEKGWQV